MTAPPTTGGRSWLLQTLRGAFGEADAIRSADLVAKLTADPERPWAEWKRGKPLTQKQLAGLLRPFGIISETVSIPGLADAKGYKRVRFEEAWVINFNLPKRRSVGMPMEWVLLAFFHPSLRKRYPARGVRASRGARRARRIRLSSG